MNKTNKIVCLVLASLVLIIIGIKYYKDNFKYEVISKPINRPIPKPDPIKDRDFVENEVIINFYDDVTETEKDNFFSGYTDIINHESIGLNMYVLTLNRNFETRSEVVNYCRNLSTNIFIEYCEPNNIIKLDDCSKGPC